MIPIQNTIQGLLGIPILAAGGTAAEPFPGVPEYITNSVVVGVIVVGIIVFLVNRATRKIKKVPGPMQNFMEMVIGGLYGQVENLVGKKLAPRAFPLLATTFIFILVSNWFGLVPGVGTIGFQESKEAMPATITIDPKEKYTPLFRPATADLNMNLAIAAIFMLTWTWFVIRETGIGAFFKHMFIAPKGSGTGVLGVFIGVIFLFVGLIEVVSIAFRPFTLSLRLYGNVFAGETLLATMAKLGDPLGAIVGFITSVLFPLPFYFLELLIGLLQATVFTLLCAVYIQLATAGHDEEHGH
ncbi:MAG: F0F1 ATP synthase subunit A [Verrucomicrobiota bacterium]